MIQKELNKILRLHQMWLNGEKEGERANLEGAYLYKTDLEGANLKEANLKEAYLYNANLEGANLIGANLKGANLYNANFEEAYLEGANLEGANFEEAYLEGANLKGANLKGANLEGANLKRANLIGANLIGIKTNYNTLFFASQCPTKGSFIGYKIASNYLIELEITDDALRSSATTRKCRCSKAKVLSIIDLANGTSINSIKSEYDKNFIYTVGEIVEVKDFNSDRWVECTSGIHFFITEEEAISYL